MRDESDPEPRCFQPEKVMRLRAALPRWNQFDERARRLKAAAHPGRLAVLRLVAGTECCVCDVSDVLEIPVSTASQYLRKLKSAGLLTSRQEGRWVIYSVPDDVDPEDFLGQLEPNALERATRPAKASEEVTA